MEPTNVNIWEEDASVKDFFTVCCELRFVRHDYCGKFGIESIDNEDISYKLAHIAMGQEGYQNYEQGWLSFSIDNKNLEELVFFSAKEKNGKIAYRTNVIVENKRGYIRDLNYYLTKNRLCDFDSTYSKIFKLTFTVTRFS